MKKYDSKGKLVGMKNKIIIASIVLVILIVFLASFSITESGEVGLRVRFGKIVDNSLTEGINFKMPFVEKIVKVNIKVQKVELAIESSTKDLQIVNTNVAVNYRVDSKVAL